MTSILFGLLTWKIDEWFVWFLVVSVAGTVVVFMLSPQINWWWYNRHPPDLPEPGIQLLDRVCGFYQRLEDAGKLRFRQRVALYLMGVEPIWDDRNLVHDVRLIPSTELDRPRIDVFIAVGNWYESNLPSRLPLWDKAIRLVTECSESSNPLYLNSVES